MNINILMIYYVWWDWHEIKKLNKCKTAVSPCCSKSFLWGIHCFKISICDSMSQFNDGAN